MKCAIDPSTSPLESRGPVSTDQVGDSVWPSQWVADVEAWTYPDFGNGTKSAKGRFFYDGVRGRTRTEWHPWIDSKFGILMLRTPTQTHTQKQRYYFFRRVKFQENQFEQVAEGVDATNCFDVFREIPIHIHQNRLEKQ